jgi:hypothetical protein
MRSPILIAVFIAASVACAAAATISPGYLLAHGSTYDGRSVTVAGSISAFRPHVSHKGNAYVTFEVCATSSCVHVFEWGSPELTEGQSLTVHGTFSVQKHVGQYTFYNEIEVENQ